MRHVLLSFLITATCYIARADDLDIIDSKDTSLEARGQAYERLSNADFSTFAAKLLRLPGAHSFAHEGVEIRTQRPWSDPAYTLRQLWKNRTYDLPTDPFVSLLDDPSIGDGAFWMMERLEGVLQGLRSSLDKSPPSIESVLKHLENFAIAPHQSISLRRTIVGKLIEHGDPNRYLDLAIELCSVENSPSGRAEAFRFCLRTPASRLSEPNRKKVVRRLFQWLEAMDDGHSGSGVGAAETVGAFAGVPAEHGSDRPFVPDPKLPQYKKEDGNVDESFFQDTVRNARKWWEEHKAEYQ